MDKRIVILKGSPRENGNSSSLADRVAEGAQTAGAEVEVFYLHSMDIRACDACDTCRETAGACIVKDDMQILYPKLEQAHGIVVASPVYWFTFSAQTKLCIDRWYALEESEGGGLKGKRFGLVMTYGDSDPYNSGAVNAFHTFQDILHYLQGELVGMVYGSASEPGDVQGQPDLLQQAYQLGEKIVSEG
jgi:multimeric flavodoxin WrbA